MLKSLMVITFFLFFHHEIIYYFIKGKKKKKIIQRQVQFGGQFQFLNHIEKVLIVMLHPQILKQLVLKCPS